MAETMPSRWQPHRLTTRLITGLGLIGGAGVIVAGLTIFATLYPAFDAIERTALEEQLGRARAFLSERLTSVENATKDYAVWDDSFRYIAGENAGFEDETLTPLALVNVGVNAIAYVRFDRTVVFARYVDAESGEELEDQRDPVVAAVTAGKILDRARATPSFSTFLDLDGKVIALGVAQVLKSDGSGEPIGFVSMARELKSEATSEALQTVVEVALDPPRTEVQETSTDFDVAIPVAGPADEVVGSLRFTVPRTISGLGTHAIWLAIAAVVAVILAVMIALFAMARRLVVSRLQAVEAHMRQVGLEGALTPLREDVRRDEIGSLSRAFNAMMRQLNDLRSELEAQSYRLGQSDWAAGVIHNVRNALNPVTVILSRVLADRAAISARDLNRAVTELSLADTSESRRERLAAFLKAAFEDVDRKAESRRENLLAAKSSIVEAMSILSSQSRLAHEPADGDAFDLREVVDQSAAVARNAPSGPVEIELPTASVMAIGNRLLVVQVVGNLLANAVESIVAADRRPGHLRVSLGRFETDTGPRVRLTVTDDGAGFDPAIAETLFVRGFSTKGRSSGLGLHWCANTVNALGGTLSLESNGPGQGATATLDLPAAPMTRMDAAAA